MDSLKNQEVLTRGHVQRTRPVGNKLAFVVVRERGSIVQCLTIVRPNSVSKQMVKYVAPLSKESIIDVIRVVSVPNMKVKKTT